LNADIDDLSTERGHRTLAIVRKGGKHVTIPIAPRTGRALDLYIGERAMGPIFLGVEGGRMDRYCADRMVKRLVKRGGIDKRISPHSLGHSFITAALDAGVPLRDVQEAASHADPRTTMRYDRARRSLDRHATNIVTTIIAGATRPPRPTPTPAASDTERSGRSLPALRRPAKCSEPRISLGFAWWWAFAQGEGMPGRPARLQWGVVAWLFFRRGTSSSQIGQRSANSFLGPNVLEPYSACRASSNRVHFAAHS
jgi:hypothetical protein